VAYSAATMGPAAQAHHQGVESIARLERRQSDIRLDGLPLRQHGTLENAGQTTSDHVRAAQIGLRESNQDCSVFLASCEINVSNEAGHQSRGVEACTFDS